MRLMFLPPGPINSPIFDGSIGMVTMRGAYGLISSRSFGRQSLILERIAVRAFLAIPMASSMISYGIPFNLRSSWKPVIPESVPAILQSMSQNASSQPMMSASSLYASILPSSLLRVQRPILMPATGRFNGTPASSNASVPLQMAAIEVEPLDSMISDVTRTAYGKSSRLGMTGAMERSANAP